MNNFRPLEKAPEGILAKAVVDVHFVSHKVLYFQYMDGCYQDMVCNDLGDLIRACDVPGFQHVVVR